MSRRRIHQVDEFTFRITFLIFSKVTYRLGGGGRFHFNLLVVSSQHLILTSQIWTNTFVVAFIDFPTCNFSFPRYYFLYFLFKKYNLKILNAYLVIKKVRQRRKHSPPRQYQSQTSYLSLKQIFKKISSYFIFIILCCRGYSIVTQKQQNFNS